MYAAECGGGSEATSHNVCFPIISGKKESADWKRGKGKEKRKDEKYINEKIKKGETNLPCEHACEKESCLLCEMYGVEGDDQLLGLGWH